MEDTIYRQQAIDAFEDTTFTKNEIRRRLSEVPSAQSENIRCKDCKHWDEYYCHNKNWGDGYGNYTPPIKKEDGFCDWAERKEDGVSD